MNKRIPPIEKVRLRTLTAVDGMSGAAGGNARAESNSPPASQTDAALGHNGDDGLPRLPISRLQLPITPELGHGHYIDPVSYYCG